MSRNRTLGAPYEQALVTSSFATEPHIDRYLVSTPGGGPAVDVTLDPNAYNGDQVTIIDVAGNAATFPIPIIGTIIEGGSSISENGGSVTLTFSEALDGWTTTFGSRSSTPAIKAVQTINTGGPTPTAATTTFDSVSFTPVTTGFVKVTASMAVTASATGNGVVFSLRLNGAVDAASPLGEQPAGGTVPNATATLVKVYPCVAGTPLTAGIQATNSTGGQTVFGITQGVSVLIEELQTH